MRITQYYKIKRNTTTEAQRTELAAYCENLRIRYGLTQRALATVAEVSTSTINRAESGDGSISQNLIAQLYNVEDKLAMYSPEELATLRGQTYERR